MLAFLHVDNHFWACVGLALWLWLWWAGGPKERRCTRWDSVEVVDRSSQRIAGDFTSKAMPRECGSRYWYRIGVFGCVIRVLHEVLEVHVHKSRYALLLDAIQVA